MRIIPFRDWKIRTKLITITLVLVLFPLLAGSFLSVHLFSRAIKVSAEENLDHLVRDIYFMCRVQDEHLYSKLASDLRAARAILCENGCRMTLDPEKEITFAAVDRDTRKMLSVTVPLWKADSLPLTGNPRITARLHSLMGHMWTLYQRVPGMGFLSVSVAPGEEGDQGAVSDLIPASDGISAAVLSGKSRTVQERVHGRWRHAIYEPVRAGDGRVMGALCGGIREQGAASFMAYIKGIRVGKTGYAYIMDSGGTLQVHPAREHQNVLGIRDASGVQYIKAMVRQALALGDGGVGTIHYRWVNPELGETRPRRKVVKFIYFKPWDWIIAAGSYEEEIYGSLHETAKFMTLMVAACVLLVLPLTFGVSKFLTRPVRDLTEATLRMVGGDLSQRVEARTNDEIGILARSFNRMVGQVQHYTSNLEKIVGARTRELKESREKYRDISRFLNSILDSATEYAIMALDFYGNIIEFNNGAERIFGWKKKAVIGKKNIAVTITPEDREKGIQTLMSKRTRTEGVCELEMDRVRKDGERFAACTTVTAIKDPSGKFTGFLEIVRDISLRKSLALKLSETRKFLENIMESSVDGIVTTDLKGKITYMNRAMEEMLGRSREAVTGEHISLYYVQGIQQARDIMDILRQRERAENYELELRGKTQVVTISTSLFLLRNEAGEVIGTAGIFKDVTEKKELEARLRSAQVRLVEASRIRALGELVAGVAHELNNPLMASKTVLHVILKNLGKGSPERERLELVRKCNDRIERIVEHLRTFSRQSRPEFQKMDINLPVENALMITGQQLVNHGISVEKRLSRDLPKVWGDPNQLEQVFLNLISNARDAMESVSGPKQLIFFSREYRDESGPCVLVSVKDSGEGILKENLDKIFDPFFSTKPVGKGTGLGLSICFGIMEAHGGRLELRPRSGKGTEARVILPVRKQGKENADAQTHPGG